MRADIKLRSSEPYDPYIPSGSQPPAGPSSSGNNAQSKKVGISAASSSLERPEHTVLVIKSVTAPREYLADHVDVVDPSYPIAD